MTILLDTQAAKSIPVSRGADAGSSSPARYQSPRAPELPGEGVRAAGKSSGGSMRNSDVFLRVLTKSHRTLVIYRILKAPPTSGFELDHTSSKFSMYI